MKISVEEATKIVNEEHERFVYVPYSQEIVEKEKYSDVCLSVFNDTETGKFYQVRYEYPCYEKFECEPFPGLETVKLTEVIEVEIVTKKWVPVQTEEK